MDYIRAILDGIAIAAIFNGAVAALALINPRYFFDSYPKAIQKAAPEQMTKKREKHKFHSNNYNLRDLFHIFNSKSYTYRHFGLLESFLDGVYSVEHIKLRRFLFVGLSVVPREI